MEVILEASESSLTKDLHGLRFKLGRCSECIRGKVERMGVCVLEISRLSEIFARKIVFNLLSLHNTTWGVCLCPKSNCI